MFFLHLLISLNVHFYVLSVANLFVKKIAAHVQDSGTIFTYYSSYVPKHCFNAYKVHFSREQPCTKKEDRDEHKHKEKSMTMTPAGPHPTLDARARQYHPNCHPPPLHSEEEARQGGVRYPTTSSRRSRKRQLLGETGDGGESFLFRVRQIRGNRLFCACASHLVSPPLFLSFSTDSSRK